MFGTALRWARSVTPLSRVWILSARWGLLHSSTRVAPYNLKMGQPGSITAARVADQLRVAGLAGETLHAVMGRPYRAVLDAAAAEVGSTVVYPVGHLPDGRMGYVMQTLAANHGRLEMAS